METSRTAAEWRNAHTAIHTLSVKEGMLLSAHWMHLSADGFGWQTRLLQVATACDTCCATVQFRKLNAASVRVTSAAVGGRRRNEGRGANAHRPRLRSQCADDTNVV
ncbi:unnamed protein product, partial [Iphiclides podalirius]